MLVKRVLATAVFAAVWLVVRAVGCMDSMEYDAEAE